MEQTITLRQLRCLLAVDDARNFRRAAERLNITQPALTAQIQNIEHVLKAKLLERGRAGVVPTPIGREIIPRAKMIIDEADALVEYATTSQEGYVGTLRLGATPTIGPYLLPSVVSRLHRQHEELQLYIRESPPQDLDMDLAEGRHDVILTQLPVNRDDLVEIPLFREPLVVACADDHLFASKKTVSPADLKGQAVLSLSPKYRLAEQIARFCNLHGAKISSRYEGTSLDAIRQMVGMNMGITFLPKLYVRTEIREGEGIVTRPLRGASLVRAMGLVYRKRSGKSSRVMALAEVMKDVATDKIKVKA